ncbi:hypothetical protein [Amphritea japonica]|uniref:Phytanoyl-CoA dioxygenase n=1 Tax=Amphritea japonica ATCC BAA-1530 TaxID=1278309 RepID=A0A7R6P9J5_9GAMM|nr:hypothetical protein [Amphritea japonica]BBB25343.1 conserved hypothetical protein [Amphritea japonica ATCC BAA-1530]
MQIHEYSTAITDAERSEILFNGDLIVFKQLSVLSELNSQVDALVNEGLSAKYLVTSDQISGQVTGRESGNKYLQRIQQSFSENPQFARFFCLALRQCGVELNLSYADKLFLRSVPPRESEQPDSPMFRGSIKPHRDTWGSNIQQQINWWSPVYPVTEQSAIVFYPDYWDRAVANSTDRWSFEAFCTARDQAGEDGSIDYPYAPQVLEPIETTREQIVVVEPGDLLCFSSAHLHASVPNSSGQTRYSYELRTFNLDDIARTHMPINVDNAATEPHYNWFQRLSDQSRLAI